MRFAFRHLARPLNLNRCAHRDLCARLAELTADTAHLAHALAPVYDVESLDATTELMARASERLSAFAAELD